MGSHEIKCEHCNNWVSKKEKTCSFCHKNIREIDQKKDLERSNKPDPFKLRLIQINNSDNLLIQFLKRIVQFGQLIFYAVISFLIWITTWAVG
jgi:hypothetical protein